MDFAIMPLVRRITSCFSHRPSLIFDLMRSRLLPSLLLASALLPTLGAKAATAGPAPEWARFRGPDGSGVGVAPNLPAKFTEADYNWKVELPGKGHSSPVIANNKVFVTCTPADSGQRMLVALNAADGKTLWQKSWEGPVFQQNADNSFSSSTPAVDAERVFDWWTSPEQSYLMALSQKDGSEIWKRELGGFVSQHGSGSSPIIFEDSVILDFGQEGADGAGSYTLCVDAATGKVRWQVPRLSTSSTASTPCIYHPTGGGPAQLIVISRNLGINALDPHTGKTIWEIKDLMPRRCVASPIVTKEGMIIVQCGEGGSESFVYGVKPAADGKSATKAFEVLKSGGYVPSPLAVDDKLFLWKENGNVSCVNAGTGAPIWNHRVDGPFYSSPVYANGRLYNITRKGDLLVLGGGDTFEQIAKIPLGEGTYAAPSFSGGRMYIRTFTHLISVGK